MADRRPVLRFVFAASFLAALTGASCGKTSTGPGSPAAEAGGWTKVATFNGAGDQPQNTEPFTLHDGKARLRFTVKPNDSGPVPFLSQMFPEGAPVSAHALQRTSCVSCDGEQAENLGSVRAGRYYLHVVTSRPWTLTVESQP